MSIILNFAGPAPRALLSTFMSTEIKIAEPPAPRSTNVATGALLVALTWWAGCGVDDRPAEWSFISPAIFQPNCASGSCHNPAAAVSGLDFSTPDRGYLSLRALWTWVPVAPDAGAPPAGTPCATINGTLVCEEPLRPLVTPYDPAGSRIVNMLRARNAPRMPPDRPLTEPDIRLVEAWILNGACQAGVFCGPTASLDAGAADGRPGS
jgi:hypothetical protein